MALVKELEKIVLERDVKHSEVSSTYSIVQEEGGKKYLQIDTYGSRTRKIPGKKSQSIRFSPQAIEQLKEIFRAHF